MSITKTLSSATRGADLLSPKLDVTYILGGIVAVVVLLFVWKSGTLVYSKGSKIAQGYIPGADTPDFAAQLRI